MAYLAASSLSWPLIRETIQLISKQSGHPSPRRRREFPGWCWYWEEVGSAACVCLPDYPPPPDFLHQITSTSWTDLKILQNSTVLYQEGMVGGLLAIKLIPLIGQSGLSGLGGWPPAKSWSRVLMISATDPTEAAKIQRWWSESLLLGILGLDAITSIYHQWTFSLSSSHRETSSSLERGKKYKTKLLHLKNIFEIFNKV